MKLISRILLLFLVILSCKSSAQKSRQPQSVLWKIQSSGSPKTSYILGSMHNFGKEWVASFPKLDSLIKVSDMYLCESTSNLETGNAAPVSASPIVSHLNAKAIFGKNYDRVNKYFINKTGEGLTKNIDNDKDPAAVLSRMLAFLMDEWTAGKGLKTSPDGMDAALLSNARSKKISCISLDEKRITQGMTSTPFFIKKTIAGIVEFINELTATNSSLSNDSNSDSYLKTLKLYNSGKFNFNFAVDPSDKLVKVKIRNNLWMKKIPAYLINNNAFIVVGAGHLDGKSGLLMQLKKRGFKISPVALL